MKHFLVATLLLLGLLPASASAQADPAALRQAVQSWRTEHGAEVLADLASWISMPNFAADAEAIQANAHRLLGMMEARGIAARLLEVPEGSPAVFGELRVPGATRTVVFYAHYDGQPTNAADWASPPYEATLRDAPLEEGGRVIPLPSQGLPDPEARLYARSASDDKSPIIAMFAALDALRAAGMSPSVNLKFFFDGEEEIGSLNMRAILTEYRSLLDGDLWLFCDGPVHQSRRLQAVFGVRGVLGLALTTYGPLGPLHSGHYGNWAPNPAARLTTLLASMRADDGTITIEGFYDDVRPVTAADRKAIAAVPPVEPDLMRAYGLGGIEGDDAPLLEHIMRPALNIDGIASGGVGLQARNAVPSTATANLDFRLVADQTPEHVRELVEAHVRKQGWRVLDHEPTADERREHDRLLYMQWFGGYPGVRTDMDQPAALAVVRSASAISGQELLRVPMLGGSLPMYLFSEILGDPPLVILPMVNHDNNQHAPNENLRIQNLWEGIDMYAGVMALAGTYWR